MYDPGSATSHHFLSVDEFAARFGVPQARSDRLTSWLRSGGLDVVSVSASRDLVMARGTVAQVDTLFGVTEKSCVDRGTPFIANDTAPRVG